MVEMGNVRDNVMRVERNVDQLTTAHQMLLATNTDLRTIIVRLIIYLDLNYTTVTR